MSRTLGIAVADDDPALGPFYQAVLARLGHPVCVAGTGNQLVEACRLLHPDLVITEVKLPDLGGIAATPEVCPDQPMPVIVVSGCPDLELVGRALANSYVLAGLLKPVPEADRGASLAVAVSRCQQLRSLATEVADVRQALEDRKLIERAKGAVMRHAGLDEAEACRRLKQLASDQNRKLVEVAQAILNATEVFQQLGQTQLDGRAHQGDGTHGDGRGLPPPTGASPRRSRTLVEESEQVSEQPTW